MIDWGAVASVASVVLSLASVAQVMSSTRQAAKRSEIDALRVIIETQGEQIKALQSENERLHAEVGLSLIHLRRCRRTLTCRSRRTPEN